MNGHRPPDKQPVEADWNDLQRPLPPELKVPVSLFVMCKTVVEDDQGALFLNATLVQRILVRNIPPAKGTPKSRWAKAPATCTPQGNIISTDDQKKLKALLFPISIKGPIPGNPAKSRRVDLADYTSGGASGSRTNALPKARGAQTTRIAKLCSETLDLVHAPLDIRQHWYMFPFRILKGTVDLELQAKYRPSEFGEGKVLLCPDLLSPIIDGVSDKVRAERLKKIIRVKETGNLSRLRRLNFITKVPVVEMCLDSRLKSGVTHRESEDDMFTRRPQLRLTFWLYEPISKAIFKIVGPLLLVVSLMLLNFQEFFGFYAVFNNECEDASGSETYQEYFANGVGIALAAFFVIPSIRAETTKSPGVSFTWDDCIAVTFLVGLALSNAPQCHVALTGCLLCVFVVLVAVISLACHNIEKKAVEKRAEAGPLIVKPPKEEKNDTKPRAVEFDDAEWTRV